MAGAPGQYRLLVLPERSFKWDGDVLTFGAVAYRPGQNLSLGGGEVELRSLTGLRLPSEWSDEEKGFRVNPHQH